MSQDNYNIKKSKRFNHLNFTERNLIEKWLKEGTSVANIAKRLGRHRSTIYREIKRGTVNQIKNINGYLKNVEVYYADSGQMKYERNREKSKSKGPKKFSKNFFKALTKAKENKQLGGKNRIYNIKSFVHCYKRDNPLDTNIPSFKTVYRYIKKGLIDIKPHDLPVMYRLAPRKNKYSKPKGQNKRILGKSISSRDPKVLKREEFGHWEADLVEGRKGKNEPVILSLVERKTRYGITRKLKNSTADTAYEALKEIIESKKDMFLTITFDNGSEFSRVSELEDDSLDIYFAHAYSAWERGTNENFNKLLRDFVPKGKSIKDYSQEYIIKAGKKINDRIREVIGFKSASEKLQIEIDKKFALPKGETVVSKR
ncbi:MAG TPA: IS30 family transposase [Tissierellaceae bacterium]|nr:IS30 family transposase [Tissierellaceae bacterium]